MKSERQYLSYVTGEVHARLEQLKEKMGENAKDLESMNDYFWENYAEFDEYGYEMYDNKMALKTRLTQQEEYVKDKARYEKMLDAPYFGRVDFCYEDEQEAETYYIGVGNLARERAAQPIVFDWRAPVSGLFYDYDKGPAQFEAPAGIFAGEITRKRQYKIRGGELIYMLETDMNIDDEILQQALSEHADSKLKSIVTTIQKEQNAIIRDAGHKIMVVQGCAGSGKTSVALHRIAYLLYHNRETLRAAQVLVLSPNSIFGDYISRILPELGEENICEMTLDDYAYRELRMFGEAEDRYDELERRLNGKKTLRADYKQSREYVKELDGFILNLEWKAVDIHDFSFRKMSMSAEKISEFFYEKLCDVPVFARMEKIAEYLIDEKETLQGKDMEEEERQSVIDKMNSMYQMTDLLEIYNCFLEEQQEMDELENGEAVPHRLQTGSVIPYEDVYPLLYLKYCTGELPKRRRVRHLIIDEMQDYSYLQYLLIQKLFACPMTILGDTAQSMSEKPADVMRFLPRIFGKDIHYVQMNKSYRSTTEIMDYANRLIGNCNVRSVERHGEMPLVKKMPDRKAMFDDMALQISSMKEMHTAAVLCLDQQRAEEAFRELKARGSQVNLLHKESMKFTPGVSVMPFYLAKGLEFDAVLVHDIQDYETALEKQALYINATRALHVLKLFSL
ncbi:MAG: AAA family ATPase [Eubacteriales bacterium]|nr:AAA family ATPase [Eubacteriales bacterium]